MNASIPRFANKPCECGAQLRVGHNLDGKRIFLDAAPAATGEFFMAVAWNGRGVYLGTPEPGEHVDPQERFAAHVHATGRLEVAA